MNVVLNFDAGTPELRLVSIRGRQYPLRTGDGMTIGLAVRYERAIQATAALIEKANTADLTDDEDAELTRLITELSAMALEAPADVVQSLTLEQRMRLVMVAFFEPTPPATAAPPAAAPARRMRRTSRRGR